MRLRRWGVIGVLVTSWAAAETTLQPAKLTLATVPDGWQLLSERAGDFLHYESSEDSEPRTIDISFDRTRETCRKWRATPGAKKSFPIYWPKKARTHLYTAKGDGKLTSSGCLADTPTGAVIASIEITTENAKYKPSPTDTALMRSALAAALAATAVVAPTAATTTPNTPGSNVDAAPDPSRLGLNPNAVRGGSVVTIPRLDFSVKLPKDAAWIVGMHGESKIERDNPVGAPLSVLLFPLPARTCTEWRVDMAASDVMTYIAKAAYLPKAATGGAFTYAAKGTQIATCIGTKLGTLGVAIDYATTLEGADVLVVRALLDAIATGGAKQKTPSYSGTPVLDGGSTADSTVGPIKLPTGAQWRVTNGTIERLDKGRYFQVSSTSRPTPCSSTTAIAHPFLPANVKATLETKPWGTSVAKVCVQTTRTIELTLAYDGAIATQDHALIRALVDAFIAKKPVPKS